MLLLDKLLDRPVLVLHYFIAHFFVLRGNLAEVVIEQLAYHVELAGPITLLVE